jgi:hypothetical protein
MFIAQPGGNLLGGLAMLTAGSHVHTAYRSLPSFEHAQDALVYKRPVVPHLGKVILKFGLEDVVGVSLLHKHFDILPDQYLVRTISGDRIIAAGARGRPDLVGSHWKLLLSNRKAKFVPIEFLASSSFCDEALNQSNLLTNNTEFLDEFADILIKHSASNYFGVATLNAFKQFNISHRTSVLCEEPGNTPDNVQISAEPFHQSLSSTQSEALWTFSAPTGEDEGVEVHCAYTCFSCM